MKVSLSPLDRLNLQGILPEKGGRYTMVLCDEIVEATKLSPEEMKRYASKQGPDFPDIPKLKEGEVREVEFSGYAGKLLQERFQKMAKEEELQLFQYRLWRKLFPKDAELAAEDEGETGE
jgi:hypothetical protein